MGTIRKHTIISSLVIYIGFVIGAFNLLVLFPRFIPVEYMGLTKVIQDYSMLLTSIAGLGFVAPFFRFNPYFQKYTTVGQNDLLQLYLLVVHLGMFLVVILSYVIKTPITNYFGVRSPLFSTYYFSTLLFGYLLLVYNVLEMYLFSKGEAIFQSVVREIVIRVVVFLIIISVILGLPLHYFVLLFSIHYIIPIALLIGFIIKNHPSSLGLSISKTTKRLSPFMMSMAGVGVLQNIVNVGLPVIDTLVIGGLVGLEGVANYLLSSYIATLVYVPVRATGSVLGAKIAEYWKENNIPRIQELYHRTSMSYMIFSFFVVSIILFNLSLFQQIIGKNIPINIWVISTLVIAKVFELSTGLSNIILGYSKKWRVESSFYIVSILLSIPMNIVFVGKWGIWGAAIATLILAFLTFSARMLILYLAYKLFPFKLSSLWFAIFGLSLSIAFYFICAQTDNQFQKLLITGLYALIYLVVVIRFKFSEDINMIYGSLLNRLKGWKWLG